MSTPLMSRPARSLAAAVAVAWATCSAPCGATDSAASRTWRLYEGITVYVANPEGRAFSVGLDVRDLNLVADGPREVLYKVYDPDGRPIVREFIPDDGVARPNFPDRPGGWDHELQYFGNLHAKGTQPTLRWSATSDEAFLATAVARTFEEQVPAGKPGIYRIVLAGTPDHYVTLRLPADLKCGVAGHPTFLHGHGSGTTSHVYVPKGTTGVFLVLAEIDRPVTRRFKLTAPDGKVLFEGAATGGYSAGTGANPQDGTIAFEKPGNYDGQLLTFEVSDGAGDYLLKLGLQQPQDGVFKDYVGMGSQAVFCPDAATAAAIQGGTIEADGLVFWHPFQVRLHQWLAKHGSGLAEPLRKDLEALRDAFRLIETSDARGTASWSNWGYSFGYYGCRIWRPGWLLMQRADVPAEVKAIIREGLVLGGDRLSMAAGGERVNGNAFSQIPVALWYASRATGDELLKERFEIFWDRWSKGGWGKGSGLGPSGDSQEHFAHDLHYGSYLLDNWRGGTWVKEGILDDAKDDPRFKQVIDRYRELYTYLYCREADGTPVAACPWSARTEQAPHKQAANWELDGHTWKGAPGPDFTVSVNDGGEWFAARRKGYYAVVYYGPIAPEWMVASFAGQLGFSGGGLCQVTVPGKGPVLAATLPAAYGVGLHPSEWRSFRINSIVGESWDSSPLVAAISEPTATLDGTTVSGTGEVRGAHVKTTRSWTFGPEGIECRAALAESDEGKVLSLWSKGRKWSEVREAHEMIPFLPGNEKQPTAVTLIGAGGKDVGPAGPQPVEATAIRIDRGGYGVRIELEKPAPVSLGAGSTVLVRLTAQGQVVAAADVSVVYRIVPYGN
jgi:hypothetical protein